MKKQRASLDKIISEAINRSVKRKVNEASYAEGVDIKPFLHHLEQTKAALHAIADGWEEATVRLPKEIEKVVGQIMQCEFDVEDLIWKNKSGSFDKAYYDNEDGYYIP